jgi:hypothetical protein
MWTRLLCLKIGSNRRLLKNAEKILSLIKGLEFLNCVYEADWTVLLVTPPVNHADR